MTPTSVDVAPLHVAGAMLVAAAIGVAGIALARLLEVIVDDGVALGRDLSRRLAVVVLRRRTGMPGTPWFCARCRSRNDLMAGRCYGYGARREEAEAPVPDADAPVGPGNGRSTRARRRS